MDKLFLLDFSEADFYNLVKEKTPQTKYLFRYLGHLNSKKIILEGHYIDRYFMEEYQNYYSNCFSSVDNFCKRLHFFSTEIDEKMFSLALTGDKKSAESLQNNYLGYVVLRPLQSQKIGRTVLVSYQEHSSRKFLTREYTIHLSSLKLQIKSLASQQQDRAVGACATTAIWSSLQLISKMNGSRSPGPYTISQNASLYNLPYRPFPQTSGLTIDQMNQAISSLGFSPLRLDSPTPNNVDMFKAVIRSYLKSNFPPIFAMLKFDGSGGHAISLSGYSTGTNYIQLSTSVLTKDFDQVYIHDDRLGPFVRTNLFVAELSESLLSKVREFGITNKKTCFLKIKVEDSKTEEDWIISEAIIPLYPKIRATIYDFYKASILFLDFLHKKFKLKDQFIIEVHIKKGGDYLETISKENFPIDEKLKFLKNISLPRYVGVTEVSLQNTPSPLFHLLWDSTDILRYAQNSMESSEEGKKFFMSIKGVICYHPDFRNFFTELFKQLGLDIPVL